MNVICVSGWQNDVAPTGRPHCAAGINVCRLNWASVWSVARIHSTRKLIAHYTNKWGYPGKQGSFHEAGKQLDWRFEHTQRRTPVVQASSEEILTICLFSIFRDYNTYFLCPRVEVGKNTPIVIPASRKKRRKGNRISLRWVSASRPKRRLMKT
jgi:hypothetical protein